MRLIRKLKFLFNPKSPDLKALEARLQYTFGNTYYLEKAITHRSVQHHSLGNYERLEFLGDAVIDQTISLWLFKIYPNSDEGTLTKKRSTLVNSEFLGIMGKNIKVIDVVRVGGDGLGRATIRREVKSVHYPRIPTAIHFDING